MIDRPVREDGADVTRLMDFLPYPPDESPMWFKRWVWQAEGRYMASHKRAVDVAAFDDSVEELEYNNRGPDGEPVIEK